MLDKKLLVDGYNRVMRKLFGIEPNWHKRLDIVKNNYALGHSNLTQGRYRDAVFRLKFLVWIDPQHKAGWLDLAKAYIALDNKFAANAALKKLLTLEPTHEEAKKLRAIVLGKAAPMPKLEVLAGNDAKAFYLIHKESFPIYWKEQEISDMLLASGTQGFLAKMGNAVGMVMTRAQFEQAEILTIAVMPNTRKQGIARALMVEAEKTLAAGGVKKIFLEVAENNEAATALYRKLGFTETSRRKGYYRQEDSSLVDALVMAKEL